ncbi:MAG: amidase, partial [Hyphomicrobiales bacterium]|nr:amidase [Hyphomicrobiales bacterium]MCC2103153.1 amidase [Hyphomicrobiales bacterium]
GPELVSPYHAPPHARAFADEVRREPGRLRIAFTDRAPSGAPIDPEISAAVRDVAKMLEKLGHEVIEKAPVLPVSPGDALSVITGANTALTVRLAEQQLGRRPTDDEFEKLTLVTAHNAAKRSSVDYCAAQLDAFRISRALAEFFTEVDVLLQPTLCLPPLKLGVLDTMGDLRTIAATLAAYMPGTAMFNMSGQPAMSVPLAWNKAGLPLGMMFAGRFGDEATLFRLAAQLEQERPWKDRKPGVCAS